MPPVLRVAVVWLLLCLAHGVPARAHECWLVVDRATASAGTPIAIGARVGEGLCGPAKPFAPARTMRFEVRTARTFDLRPVAAAGDTVWARFAAADERGAMLAWESTFVPHRMPAPAFDAYLVSDGHDSVLAVRRAARDTSAGRERYRRCAKRWLRGAASDPARAIATLGLPLELAPLAEPGVAPVLGVRVLRNGHPLPGALVQAWRGGLGANGDPVACAGERSAEPAWRGRTDAEGRARVPCGEPGEWLIGCVNMVGSADPAAAEWESTWASLAFVRPRGVPR